MLFVHELIIWCENEIYPRVFVVTAGGSTRGYISFSQVCSYYNKTMYYYYFFFDTL